MTVEGIEYVYLETRNWGRSTKFWQTLGYELELDLGSAGRLAPPGGGPGVFIQEVSPETPLATGIYLKAASPDFAFEPPVEKVGDAIDTHWNSKLQTIRDPDGREFIVQHTPPQG